MAKVNYTQALKSEYLEMYRSMEIRIDKLSVVEQHVNQILLNKNRYKSVGNQIGVPWFFIALIHTMESSRNFNTHLHNGDPLNQRTVQVPSGRPIAGSPPFTWEESALDALKHKKLDQENDWSLPRILYQLENYNGWGYRLYHTHVKSPYLWSYSNKYISGKYTADGVFSDTAVSRQCGSAAILKRIEQRNEIPRFDINLPNTSFYFYSNNIEAKVEELQRFLNTLPGISLLVDGKPGDVTSEACKKIFGEFLIGDIRKS